MARRRGFQLKASLQCACVWDKVIRSHTKKIRSLAFFTMNGFASATATPPVHGSPIHAPSVSQTSPSTNVKRSQQLNGPCFLKMLVSNVVAGSIIGKSGTVIGNIESTTGCTLRLSPASVFFPGTSERIVVLSGEQEHLEQAVVVILEKIRDSTMYDGPMQCKLVVPKSAVSALIGKAGASIKQLQENTGAKVQISSREEGSDERVITINGSLESIQSSALSIAASVQADPNLRDHAYPYYYQNGPGGAFPMGGQHMQYGGPSSTPPFAGPHAGGPYGTPTFPPIFPPHMGAMHTGPDIWAQHCEIILQMPDACVGPVIGRNGVNLTEIQHQSGAKIQISQKGELVPGTSDRKVTVEGTVQGVHMAHVLLLQRLYDVQQTQKHLGPAGAAGTMQGGRGDGGAHSPGSVPSMAGQAHAQQQGAAAGFGAQHFHGSPYAGVPSAVPGSGAGGYGQFPGGTHSHF
eukprot:Polyplicarium_translucidae@DN3267_c0_g1_i1.p2